MQKKQIFLIGLISILLILGIFSTISLERVYDYAQFETKIKSISLSKGDPISLVVDESADAFVIALNKDAVEDPNSITVRYNIDGTYFTRGLDTEDTDETDSWYTFPLVAPERSHIDVEVFWYSGDTAKLIATDSNRSHIRLGFHAPLLFADTWTRIFSRSEWWADESLRYVASSVVAQNIADWEARGKTKKIVTITQAEQDARDRENQIGRRMKELHPWSFFVQSKIFYENGRKLTWPINRAKQIDQIVIHHTAENTAQSSMDDITVLRSIYAYHARTRGWGDIGYNFIIGRDGTVYEGRSGGLYVQWAHAYMNNLGTVGVSLIGNFDVNSVPQIQYDSLKNFLVFLSKKYGINVLEDTTGFRECAKGSPSTCLIDERPVKRLHAHRDVGYTSCPGANLYAMMDDLRSSVAQSVGSVIPVINPEPYKIQAAPPEDWVEYIVGKSSSTSVVTKTLSPTQVSPSLGGAPIRIKLSYPVELLSLRMSAATNNIRIVQMDGKRISPALTKNIEVWIVWNNKLSIKSGKKTLTGSEISYKSRIVRIDSWSRIPTWDTTGKYNDNLFRWTIRIRNQDGKLLVINELPIEDYLRGLGEVSNTDLTEKIKTIIIAARSYARYYIDPKNRKYDTPFYDGSDDPDSFQKYLGYGYEARSPNVSQLVKSTRGEVVTYSGSIVKVWYHSSSDGKTLSYQEYCQSQGRTNCENIPYLQSVVDPGSVGQTRSGHGVGISGIGATYFAKQWWDYKRIIQYYLSGVDITKK